MLAYSEFINYCYSILPLASYETSDILLYLMVVYELLVFIGLLAHLCCSYMFFRLTTQIYCHRRLLGYDRLLQRGTTSIQMIFKNFLIYWNFEFNLKSCFVRTYLGFLFMFERFEV